MPSRPKNDPLTIVLSYEIDFYGSNYNKLLSIKQKYDPLSVFYCPTCVGSSAFAPDSTGRLCRTSS